MENSVGFAAHFVAPATSHMLDVELLVSATGRLLGRLLLGDTLREFGL
jgi:hypothetical protein